MRPSRAWPSAPITAVSTQYFTSTMPPHGAGGLALTMVPGGVMTVRGRNAPEFTSLPGSRKDLTMVNAPVGAMAGPTLVGPAVCGDVPVRSTVMRVARDGHLGAHGERLEPLAPALEVRLVVVLAVGQLADRAAHALLGAVHQLGHRVAHRGGAVARGQRLRCARPPSGRCRSSPGSRPAARAGRACWRRSDRARPRSAARDRRCGSAGCARPPGRSRSRRRTGCPGSCRRRRPSARAPPGRRTARAVARRAGRSSPRRSDGCRRCRDRCAGRRRPGGCRRRTSRAPPSSTSRSARCASGWSWPLDMATIWASPSMSTQEKSSPS